MYRTEETKNAIKQYKNYRGLNSLKAKLDELKEIIKKNPYQYPPAYEIMIGDLKDVVSRRINHAHRLVYTIDEERKVILIHSVWAHYKL